MPEEGAWPPSKDGLERLYLVEKRSAAKIALVYGLTGRYKNPKVAESTVLYHLRKLGIKRRDPAEHVRKVTEEMVDEWARRYQAGESLKQIAGDSVDAVTVWNHLRARGVGLRDMVEAQIKAVTKHEKRPFNEGVIEKAYLMGLRLGDLDAVRHGRAVRVRLSTTHPTFADLFESLFSPYGAVRKYPRETKVTGFEWNLECDLDDSFDFLLAKPNASYLKFLGNLEFLEFLAFLAGFFDAEGCIYYHKKQSGGSFELSLTSTNREILEIIAENLIRLGLHPSLRLKKSKATWMSAAHGIVSVLPQWEVQIWRIDEVKKLFGLMPIRHPEKITRAEIALRLGYRPSNHERRRVIEEWKELSKAIESEVAAYAVEASNNLSRRVSAPTQPVDSF